MPIKNIKKKKKKKKSLVQSNPPYISWIPSLTRKEYYVLAATLEMLHSGLKSSSL